MRNLFTDFQKSVPKVQWNTSENAIVNVSDYETSSIIKNTAGSRQVKTDEYI